MLVDVFIEIAIEAEMSAKEHPELAELAYEMCNEDLATKSAAIEELRSLIYEKGECLAICVDDALLLKFLRMTSFVVPRAYKKLEKLSTFRERHPHHHQHVNLWSFARCNCFEATFLDHPSTGRLVYFRIGLWDPSVTSSDDLIAMAIAMLQIGTRQPKLQVIGGSFILDLGGMSMAHVAQMTPTLAYQMVSVLEGAGGCRTRSIHIINYSWVLNSLLYMFKPLIPQRNWQKIHFHGSDLKSLHKHISPQLLPPLYGGTCKYTIGCGEWFRRIQKYRTEDFDREMKQLGYIVKTE